MSSVEQPHKVILKDVDISRHVISIDKFTDVGSVGGVGEISSAQIMLNSDFGRFTNVAPKVEQFNEFDIKVTSPYDANETYQRKMILDEIMHRQKRVVVMQLQYNSMEGNGGLPK